MEDDRYRYRRLNEGEIIKEGDEVLTDSDLGWRPAGITVGQRAPNPNYTSHRVYRRLREERPMSYLLLREVWDPMDEGPPVGRYLLGVSEHVYKLDMMAGADFEALFPHSRDCGPLVFHETHTKDSGPEANGLREWEASLGDGSPVTWSILELRNGAGSQIQVSPIPGLAGAGGPEAGVLPQGDGDNGRPAGGDKLGEEKPPILLALAAGADPGPWAENLAVPVRAKSRAVLIGGEPPPVDVRVLTEENYQLARACVNAVFERGKPKREEEPWVPPFRFTEQVKKGEVRSYKGRLYEAKQDIKAETNSPPYSAFWQTVRKR